MREVFFSVDLETSSSDPARGCVLSLGCVPVKLNEYGEWSVHGRSHYSEWYPRMEAHVEPEALAVNGLSLLELRMVGVIPIDAVKQFAEWVDAQVELDERRVFAGWNAAFDYAFWRAELARCGRYDLAQLFHHSVLDIRSLAFAYAPGAEWGSGRQVTQAACAQAGITVPSGLREHHAGDDALRQAYVLAGLLNHRRKEGG